MMENEVVRLWLMPEFELWAGRAISVPRMAQRVLAFLSVARRPVSRVRIGGALWPEGSQARADGNLRSALWRLHPAGVDIVVRRADTISLGADVHVDIHEIADLAAGVVAGRPEAMDRLPELVAATEILPTWDEPWLIAEREAYRQLRLHALERAGERCLAIGDYARAITLGLIAVDSDPLRESAHRLLIASHLGEGNAIEAIRAYVAYRRLVLDELGVDPSTQMQALIEPVRTAIETAGVGGVLRG